MIEYPTEYECYVENDTPWYVTLDDLTNRADAGDPDAIEILHDIYTPTNQLGDYA